MTDFIYSQRERIIATENTAQMELLDILEKSLPTIDDLVIDVPLKGDINFDILKKCDFKNITGIIFSSVGGGEITSLRGIPEGIKRIECPRNLLIDIELPASIEIVNIQENAVESIDFSKTPNLKILNISFNRFNLLERLPETLETLVCDNNTIRRIDLDGIEKLSVLHCSNNGLLSIEHMPYGVSDFVMENNPMIHIERRGEGAGEGEEEDNRRNEGNIKIEFSEGLTEYFKLKSKYENKVKKMKRDIYEKNTSKKKARKIINMLKPPCVNCQRPVGTFFSVKDRHYLARCGDPNENTRCLEIDIFAGEYNHIRSAVTIFSDILEINRENIIRLKLDTLFQYISESDSVAKFKLEMEDYTENSVLQKEISDKYNELFFNEFRQGKIDECIGKIFETEQEMRTQYAEYKETGNTRILQMVMETYRREYIPEIGNLRGLKYEIMEMDKVADAVMNTDDYVYELFQKTNGLSKDDFTFGENPTIIKYMKKLQTRQPIKK